MDAASGRSGTGGAAGGTTGGAALSSAFAGFGGFGFSRRYARLKASVAAPRPNTPDSAHTIIPMNGIM
jgi:hypothetical protein